MCRMKQDARWAGIIAVFLSVGLLASLRPSRAQEGEAPAAQGDDEPVAKGGKGKKSEHEPDYTKGEKLDAEQNYCALGPTGAMGNVWSDGEQTRNTRMIQTRSVKKGTRAEGVLNVGDVILGVIAPVTRGGSKPDARFESDVRKVLSAAITEAEKKENGGKLVLNVWRLATGTCEPVTITLPVMGTYSATSPWECEKTKALIDAACQSILDRGFYRYDEAVDMAIPNLLEALGLLATGEKKYLSYMQTYARGVAGRCVPLDIMSDGQGDKGVGTWDGGYRNLFLTEYYLATKDEEVLPGIAALSTYLALGQSGVGTWSHGMADVKQNGLYGPACAYGAMNQCSMTCAISLILARKCGIQKKEIDDAVVRSLKFYRWYVDKGTVPYGDHPPAERHDNNGKNSQAAVMFDLAGDKVAAGFFARSTLASYNHREAGHTGHFFSWQWGALGAARGGPEAAQSFIRNTRWFTELERRPDGGSVYQSSLGRGEHGKYARWSSTGSRLLQHCLPRKALYITGKEDGSCVPPIVGDDLKTVVDAECFDPSGLSVKDLLSALGNWSVVVRIQAAEELGKRDEDVVQDLIAMLDSPNRYARYGACEGLHCAGRKSDAAVDALVRKVEGDHDLTMRYFAVNALKQRQIEKGQKDNGLGAAVLKATPALLKLAATYEPDQDPGRKLQCIIAELMFYGGRTGPKGYFPSGRGTENLDRALLIPAMKSWLINPNGAARSSVSSVFAHLSEEDLKQVWGDIYYATKYPAPSGVMFAGGVRINGLKVMSQHAIEEGIEVGVNYVVRQTGWGDFGRKGSGMPLLLTYGKALEPYLPEINKVFEVPRWIKSVEEWKKILDAAMAKPLPVLKSIKSYIEQTPDPRAALTKP